MYTDNENMVSNSADTLALMIAYNIFPVFIFLNTGLAQINFLKKYSTNKDRGKFI